MILSDKKPKYVLVHFSVDRLLLGVQHNVRCFCFALNLLCRKISFSLQVVNNWRLWGYVLTSFGSRTASDTGPYRSCICFLCLSCFAYVLPLPVSLMLYFQPYFALHRQPSVFLSQGVLLSVPFSLREFCGFKEISLVNINVTAHIHI